MAVLRVRVAEHVVVVVMEDVAASKVAPTRWTDWSVGEKAVDSSARTRRMERYLVM